MGKPYTLVGKALMAEWFHCTLSYVKKQQDTMLVAGSWSGECVCVCVC